MARPRIKTLARKIAEIERTDRERVLKAFREGAKREYEREGEIEIDDDAKVSMGDDDGAYVEAWVWVNFEELKS